MLDEALLDDPESLTRGDAQGLLRALASAGARVRTAARLADEAGLAALRPDGRPRNVLVAGQGPAVHAGELLGAVAGAACPVLTLRPASGADGFPHWTLPGWAGSLDLLLLATPNGAEAGLANLVEQAYQRGCSVVAVTPPESPLSEAAEQARGLSLPFAPAPFASEPSLPAQPGLEDAAEDAGALWALLVPLLILADRLGTGSVPASAVQSAADRLDEMASRCGPATATYQNPAKTLATELTDTLPLLWSEGMAADAIARRFASCLAERAGIPALPAALPDALIDHRGLLAGSLSPGGVEDDFFRDRLEEPKALRPRVVLMREYVDGTLASEATAAHRAARANNTALSEVSASADSTLERAAQMLALTDFASAYLALADRS
ncbi:SIS domain-containing protein [Wenjunlia tyrosinilytica]|uniref:Bifunctional glucose-6-phosphate/mannose-6-phosphate isomerase n=1 Tax=Wenjunlia tyrosinilytica TaxID=1544741 RepID=A0A917ZNN5_9ACTN|nr:SIS domain-containing protein [Wenjunlia tyrosinilytica]GGO88062.1 bifunctional glucose-6-phosphate/mannose-6-phosphate isomerase [Wenjunlia tyrosinilytica]